MNLLNYLLKAIGRVMLTFSRRNQFKYRLNDLSLWGLKVNNNGNLSVNGVDFLELADCYGSPLMVVNCEKLIKDAKEIQQALKHAPDGSQITYSYKTNCIPGILKQLHNIGIGAEVISPYELWLAEKLNVFGNKIIYNGVNKTDESISSAIRLGLLSINIDHMNEIDRIYNIAKQMDKPVRVGIRLGLSNTSQFGLSIPDGEAMAAYRKIKSLSDYLHFNCIHFNTTSNSKTDMVHSQCACEALNFIAKIKEDNGNVPEFLDIGGGFGVPTTKNMSGFEYGIYRLFGALPVPPDPMAFQGIDLTISRIIMNIKKKCFELNLPVPKLIIEPGRFVTSRSEFLLSRVLTIKKKHDGTCYAITDAGRLSTTFPCDFEYHEVFIANRPHAALKNKYNIMGRICTSADWMFKNRYMPPLSNGDILAVMDAGAYFSSYSSNFAFPRPAIIMIKNGVAHVIRRTESYKHLTAMDTVWN